MLRNNQPIRLTLTAGELITLRDALVYLRRNSTSYNQIVINQIDETIRQALERAAREN